MDNIMKIATKFYIDLYTPNKVDTNKQNKLLGNIKNKISQEQREKLDAPMQIFFPSTIADPICGRGPAISGHGPALRSRTHFAIADPLCDRGPAFRC